ncbi:MAG TPA: hypothetical protein VGN28_02095 [Blastococcus sp.]|jgi:nicotinamidase-related amidase|nr:hypothetical protein [Blastococcus sp.]
MTEPHAATQVLAALDPRPDEPVVTKRRVSAFTGVVLSTLRQAADLDYRLTVLADGDPEVHRVLTEKVFPRQAAVTTVDEWIATLG